MAKTKSLVIVESPAKAKTINKYLGPDYVVTASMGHVRDLPSKGINVDIENNFEPTYKTSPGKTRTVSSLKSAMKSCDTLYLATDLDREGEAIAWHLSELLKIPSEKTYRVVFNSITKNSIQQAFEKPGKLDMDKVNAQQARRILDRIVGYQISPLLWKKVARGLSAGRVQSVAVRLLVERERQMSLLQATLEEEREKARFVAQRQLEAGQLQSEEIALMQGAQFATKLLTAVSGPELERRLMDLFFDEFSSLSADQLSKLQDAAGNSSDHIIVTSAYSIDSDHRQALEHVLHKTIALSGPVQYERDGALLAGIRINVGAWILRANLLDELEGFTGFFHES